MLLVCQFGWRQAPVAETVHASLKLSHAARRYYFVSSTFFPVHGLDSGSVQAMLREYRTCCSQGRTQLCWAVVRARSPSTLNSYQGQTKSSSINRCASAGTSDTDLGTSGFARRVGGPGIT